MPKRLTGVVLVQLSEVVKSILFLAVPLVRAAFVKLKVPRPLAKLNDPLVNAFVLPVPPTC